jgi:lipase
MMTLQSTGEAMPPRHFYVTANGITQSVYEWTGTGTPVLFIHATGFHARLWDAVIDLLPGVHAYAVDVRGHGLSEKPAPPYSWLTTADDVAALCAALGIRSALGVGHSMGGYTLTYAQAHHPHLFRALLLIDPVIFSETYYVGALQGEHFAARRRADWTSPDEMYDSFKLRKPFNQWQPRVLRDYVDYGLLPTMGGGFALACPPEIESSLYMHSAEVSIYPEIAQIEVPVTVLRAKIISSADSTAMDFSVSPTVPDLANRFQHGTDVHMPEHSHFIPMESPEVVAKYTRHALSALTSSPPEAAS